MPHDIEIEVSEFIKNLKSRFNNLWWPNFLFHFADILNVASIIETAKLCGRNQAKELNLLKLDSAEQEILNNTPNQYFECARLYFKPKAPPLFAIEGFKESNEAGPHCPVPVYLLFDSKKILSMPNIAFSNVGLGSSHRQIYSDKTYLDKLDFDKIYHDTALPPDEFLKRDIIRHRCAEVIVQGQVDLDEYLSIILCRSFAERETLLNLLSTNSQTKYSNRIKVYPHIFCRQRPYFKSVELSEEKINFDFYQPLKYLSSKFQFKYQFFTDEKTIEQKYVKVQKAFIWSTPKKEYSVKVFIDHHIAFLGKYKSQVISP